MHAAGVAESLSRSLDEDAHEVPLAGKRPRLADRLAVALAAPDRERAGPAEELAHDRDGEQLRLGHEDHRPRAEGADERRIDRREVVHGDDGTALGGHAF
jgi:hypothetical protein